MSYKYCLYSYIERIQYRAYEYNNEFKGYEFDKGIIKSFSKALELLEVLLKKYRLLKITAIEHNDEKFIRKHKKIMIFNIDIDIEQNEDILLDITKQYAAGVQYFYNELLNKNDSLYEGTRFGCYILLDMLENDLASFECKGLFKNFNIPIPVSLDKKVKISKI